MNQYIQISLLSGLLLLPAAGVFAANTSTTDSTNAAAMTQMMDNSTGVPVMNAAPALSLMDIVNRLDMEGYTYVKSIELGSNGSYKIDTIDGQGKKLEFSISHLDQIKKSDLNGAPLITMKQAAQAVQDAGYTDIVKIKNKGNDYQVKAYDANGKLVRLHVNVFTKEISKDWF